MFQSTLSEPETAACRLSSTNYRGSVWRSAYQRDFDFDFASLKRLFRTDLEESGYHSALTRSQNSQYGTGWLFQDAESIATTSSCDEWDGYMTIDDSRVKIRDVSDLLISRYAFVSGGKGEQGFPVLTFPDSHVQLSFGDYRLLVNYLARLQPVEDIFNGFEVVIDRRTDRWSSVKTVLSYMTLFFPGNLRVAYVLKPDGMFQRALEVGYKKISEDRRFQVLLCNSVYDLHRQIHPSQLTVDLGGTFAYNHLEWVQHRMEVERLRCSAEGLARTLDEFVQNLKDTELPNNASTTANILASQTADKDAIKEDFHIVIRRGFQLLRLVRQAESKPNAEQLSPTRLHNVTSVQRMLLQLEDAERSFDKFWPDHELRLERCLRLRQFEEDFKKLQANFLNHLDRLKITADGRCCGEDGRLCSVEDVNRLIDEYQSYALTTREDVEAAKNLKLCGEKLLENEERELIGSITPKCQELDNLTDQLEEALLNRSRYLRTAKCLQDYVASVSQWCSDGVQLLTNTPMDFEHAEECESQLGRLCSFLDAVKDLHFDPEADDSLLLLNSYDTKTLLDQVNGRLSDVKQLCQNRCVFLKRLLQKTRSSSQASYTLFNESQLASMTFTGSYQQTNLPKGSDTCSSSPQVSEVSDDSPEGGRLWSELAGPKRSAFVINELLTTEQTYVDELGSVVRHYVTAFRQQRSSSDQERSTIFGNLEEIYDFHSACFLPCLLDGRSDPVAVAKAFLMHSGRFQMYIAYCLNKPRSEALLRNRTDCASLLKACQQNAGHALPLSAYLLKPVQRITKYQLLLKELARSSKATEQLEQAVQVVLDLLHQANATLNQGFISGYAGDLASLGPVLMEARFRLSLTKKAGDKALRMRRPAKIRQRHVFLYSTALLMCKQRQSSTAPFEACYEVKEELSLYAIEQVDFVNAKEGRLHIVTGNRVELLTFTSSEEDRVYLFVSKLKQLINNCTECGMAQLRPISWGSHSSNETNSYSKLNDRKRHSETDLQCGHFSMATSGTSLARSEHNLMRCFDSAMHRSRSVDDGNKMRTGKEAKRAHSYRPADVVRFRLRLSRKTLPANPTDATPYPSTAVNPLPC